MRNLIYLRWPLPPVPRTRTACGPYIGKPLTAYLTSAGSPTSYYDLADGRRNFVFERSGIATTLPA